MMIRPCCCLRLRTGVFLIGVFEIISWSVALTVSCVGLLMTIGLSKYANLFNQIQNGTEVETDQAFETAYIVSGVSLSLSVVRIVIACVLLLGVQKESICMITTWICVKIVTLFFAFGTFISSMFLHMNAEYPQEPRNINETNSLAPDDNDHKFNMGNSTQNGLGNILFYLLNILVSVYFICVAYSLVKELKSRTKPRDLRFKAADKI